MISYKEAREKVDKRYTKVTRYKDAWWFAPPEAKNMVGGDQGRVVMKEDGRIMLLLTVGFVRNQSEVFVR